jgi:TPR repeat protein
MRVFSARALRVLAVLFGAVLLMSCQQMGDDLSRLGQAISGGGDPQELYQQARELDAQDRDGEAVTLYRKAARAGSAEAAYELGEAYRDGDGVAPDLEQAADWFNQAAQQGSPRGQYLLGRAAAEGRGVEQDYERAARWFARAAAQGYPPAQHALGRAFMNGEGVPADPLWAGRWYGKAARRGEPQAQFSYGAILADGQRVPRDRALGYAFLARAADNGVAAAEPLAERVRAGLSPGQRRAAERHLAQIQAEPGDAFADPPTIRYVQAALRLLGHDAGPVDGLMGPATRAGIQSFQRDQGMTVDGELTPDLLRAVLRATRVAA